MMAEINTQIDESPELEGTTASEDQAILGVPKPEEEVLDQTQDETHDKCRSVFNSPEQEFQFDEQYKTIHRLLDRLGGSFYRGNPLLWEEEISELAETADSITSADSDLKHVVSDKKYSKTWKKLAQVVYTGMHKTESEDVSEKLSNTLVHILKVADPHTNKGPADSVFSKILNRWPWSEFLPKKYNFFKPKHTKESDKNETVLRKYFDQIGIDPETAFKAWYESNGRAAGGSPGVENSHPVLTAEKNMMEMRRLELQHPGGPKSLVDNFGIYCFARYPEGMLDDQLDQVDDFSTPYGIIVSAAGDYNGNSYRRKSIDTYRSLLEQCRSLGIHVRVIEANNQRDLRKRFFFLENRYNTPGKRKASFGIACGHANVNVFALGKGTSELEEITSSDLRSGNFAEDSRRFFEKDSYFVIDGCLAGKEGGFTEEASKISPHLHFLAPSKGISYMSSIKLTKNEGDTPPTISTAYRSGVLPIKDRMKYYKGPQDTSDVETHSEESEQSL